MMRMMRLMRIMIMGKVIKLVRMMRIEDDALGHHVGDKIVLACRRG